jgi:hypothetical protein
MRGFHRWFPLSAGHLSSVSICQCHELAGLVSKLWGPQGGFQRTANQQNLAKLDSAVRNGRDEFGRSIMQNFGGALKAVGIGGTGKRSGTVWDSQYETLCTSTRSISAEEAKELMDIGWVLLDVRPNPDYEVFHPKGSQNAPQVQYITGTSPRQLLRKGLYAAQAVKPIEGGSAVVFTCICTRYRAVT